MQQADATLRRHERGFALLFVVLMAAMISIALYAELPRAAFEEQRQKEQLLIERGEQYQRAIELFFRKNGRYPARIEELENSGNRRFLRHRFIDPMTGRDDWRLIRIGPGGILVDSAISGSRLGIPAPQGPPPDAASNPADQPPPVSGGPPVPAPAVPAVSVPAEAPPPLALIGGNIAGVASTSEHESIMLYHGRRSYREWEFIFDFTKRRRQEAAR